MNDYKETEREGNEGAVGKGGIRKEILLLLSH